MNAPHIWPNVGAYPTTPLADPLATMERERIEGYRYTEDDAYADAAEACLRDMDTFGDWFYGQCPAVSVAEVTLPTDADAAHEVVAALNPAQLMYVALSYYARPAVVAQCMQRLGEVYLNSRGASIRRLAQEGISHSRYLAWHDNVKALRERAEKP